MELHIKDLIIPKFDDALIDILDHNHTHYSFPGGRGGTKSSFIGIVIPLLLTQNPELNAVVFRKVGSTLRDSVFAQILAGINLLGLSEQFKYTFSPLEITYKPKSKKPQKILFRGLDEPGKSKSIKVVQGYIAITWFEELDQFHGRKEIRTVLQSTIRGGEKFWNFESFNPPITAANWVNKDVNQKKKDRLVTWSNYLDTPVEWLGEQFILEAEELRKNDERAYRHEYLGEAVGTGGAVFENVVARTITDEEIRGFDRIRSGVDWGYYPDPFAFTRSYFHSGTRTLYIFDEIRALKKIPRETGSLVLEKIDSGEIVTCDNTPPENTKDYIEQGIRAKRANKGPGSVARGTQWLQGLTAIVIDPERCPNTYEEFISYEYLKTKTGEILNEYPDANNHFIDSVRYGQEDNTRFRETPRESLLDKYRRF